MLPRSKLTFRILIPQALGVAQRQNCSRGTTLLRKRSKIDTYYSLESYVVACVRLGAYQGKNRAHGHLWAPSKRRVGKAKFTLLNHMGDRGAKRSAKKDLVGLTPMRTSVCLDSSRAARLS